MELGRATGMALALAMATLATGRAQATGMVTEMDTVLVMGLVPALDSGLAAVLQQARTQQIPPRYANFLSHLACSIADQSACMSMASQCSSPVSILLLFFAFIPFYCADCGPKLCANVRIVWGWQWWNVAGFWRLWRRRRRRSRGLWQQHGSHWLRKRHDGQWIWEPRLWKAMSWPRGERTNKRIITDNHLSQEFLCID
jgi:hypothetical protein